MAKVKGKVIDVRLIDAGGSLCLVRPLTQAAEDWLDENVGRDNGYQPYWPTAIVEKRYVHDLALGMMNDGLVL